MKKTNTQSFTEKSDSQNSPLNIFQYSIVHQPSNCRGNQTNISAGKSTKITNLPFPDFQDYMFSKWLFSNMLRLKGSQHGWFFMQFFQDHTFAEWLVLEQFQIHYNGRASLRTTNPYNCMPLIPGGHRTAGRWAQAGGSPAGQWYSEDVEWSQPDFQGPQQSPTAGPWLSGA